MYGAVNEALNRVFLGGRFESRPLYLVLDKRARDELAEILGDELDVDQGVEDACCRVVGVSLATAGDPYAEALFDALMWRANGRRTLPPFTAVLFTLARAAELMVSDGQFTSNNYYQRLASITGLGAQHFGFHGSSTEKLWRSFNNWLADTDFQFGRPTARAINSFRYVGIAMSQAIVREEDRQRFHDMFEKYGFRDADAITEDEIAQYIGNWIHGAKPTRQLKAAWAKAELRPRICEAAVAELREWSSEGASASAGATRGASKLSLAASFRQDNFSLTRSIVPWIGREVEMATVDLGIAGRAPSTTLGNSTFGSFATVEPRAAIDWVTVLTRGLVLESPNEERFAWAARAVIPLTRSERGNYWIEVSRVSLGIEHVVLVRDEHRARKSVEAILGQCAAPGFSLSTGKELKGLPAGWVAYEGVRFIGAVENPDGFQLPLSPLGDTSGLQVLGGLKMGQSIWHEARPPSVYLDTRGKAATLTAWAGTSTEGEKICQAEGEHGHVSLDIENCEKTESGNLYVEGTVSGAPVGSATLLLRSAARPRPLDRQLRGFKGYTSAWEATQLEPEGKQARGLIIPAVAPSDSPIALGSFSVLGKVSGEEEVLQAESEVSPWTTPAISLVGLSPDEVLKLPCEVRGLHVYRYETLPPDFPKYAPVNKQCKDCGRHVLEHRARAKPTPSPAAKVQAKSVPLTSVPAVSPEKLEMDLWFDAASFWGRGSLAAFEALVSADGLDPWKAAHVLRDLSWLGHLDLDYTTDLRPRSWSLAPPVLAFADTKRAFLAGFRNAVLVEEVAERLRAAKAKFASTDLPRQPRLLEIEGITAADARAALDGLQDFHGREVFVAEEPGLGVARFASGRTDLSSAFTPLTLSRVAQAEHFDLARLRWRPVESTSMPGAYRFTYAGTQYAFRAASGDAFSTSHELAKLAAARLEGIHLHAYDEDARVFSSVLGCEPPALLSRALVACSGTLPAIQGGVSSFAQVPAGVAQQVLTFLYTGAIPS